jgi:outer membrane protein assembly factor BamB
MESILLAAMLLGTAQSSADVPAWRGDGRGMFRDADPPTEWGDGKNVKWVAKTGAAGYGSPVLMNGKIFVLSEPNELYAVDPVDGRVLWKKTIDAPSLKLPKKAGAAGNTAATPVAGGGRIYAVLGNGLVAATREDGTEAWTILLDQPKGPEYGRSASPLIVGGKLLVMGAYLAAVDPENGRVLWEAKEALATYGTPARVEIGGTEFVVTPNGDLVRVSDGRILLREIGRAENTSPLVHEGVVYFVGPVAAAVRLDGTAKAERLWEVELEGDTFASPVLAEGRLHTLSADGTYRAIDVATGRVVVRTSTGLNETETGLANVYPSVTLAGKVLCLGNDRGMFLLLAPGDEYKELRRNQLETGAGSSPIFRGRYAFLRGERKLYCIGP